ELEIIEFIREFGDRAALGRALTAEGREIPATIAVGDRSGRIPLRTTGVVVCNSWNEFIARSRVVLSYAGRPAPFLYRCHGNSGWLLQSEVERMYAGSGIAVTGAAIYGAAQASFLNGFVRDAAPILGRDPSDYSEDRWWSIARHHGLLTPLLDWSS